MNFNKTKTNPMDEKPTNPPCSLARSISDKRRRGTHEKTTFTLKEP
jgi:hypothetical protein